MSQADSGGGELPVQGRLLGIDYGTVRIGLALCDSDQTIAGPFVTYIRRSPELDARFFGELIRAEKIVGLVIGLPLHLSGRDSQKSREIEKFSRWLGELSGCPFAFYDERFSTAMAEELMGGELTRKQRKARIDKIAAQVILADYLQSDRRSTWQQSLD